MKKICIDPGHGGTDRANRGTQGYIEADGNLEFAKALKNALGNYGCEVCMTREEDKTVALKDRGLMAKNCDLFLSVHSNAGGGTGTSVYYSIRQKSNLQNAEDLCQSVASYFGKKARGAKYRESTNSAGYDYYSVIFYAEQAGCPQVYLLERLFHDNTEEELLLLDKTKTAQSAAVVADWIAKVLSLAKNTPESAPAPAPNTDKNGGCLPGIYEVAVGSLNQRKGPGTAYDLAGSATHKGDRLTVTEVRNVSWGYVSNLDAWVNVSKSYCNYVSALSEVSQTPGKELAPGDLVRVSGLLYSNRNGGNTVSVDRELYVTQIYTSGAYPIAFSKTKNGTVLGYGSKVMIP